MIVTLFLVEMRGTGHVARMDRHTRNLFGISEGQIPHIDFGTILKWIVTEVDVSDK
jgi:hypothetical protein